MKRIKAIAVGQLIYDHVFMREPTGIARYISSRGGGPVWNSAVYLAQRGCDVIGIGSGGDDAFGQLCLKELEDLGVETSRIHLVNGKRTRVISECIERDFHGGGTHRFTGTCQICSTKLAEGTIARIQESDAVAAMGQVARTDLIIADRLTADRLRIVRKLKDAGGLAAIDLGRLGHLRYRSVHGIVNDLSTFELVVLPRSVSEAFLRRLSAFSWDSLSDLVQSKTIVITDGPKRIQLYFRHAREEPFGYVEVPVRNVSAVDSCGAGDVFFATIAEEIVRNENQAIHRDSLVGIVEAGQSAAVQVLGSVGARGYLPKPKVKQALLVEMEGREVRDVSGSVAGWARCPFCLSDVADDHRPDTHLDKPAKARRYGVRQNVSRLAERCLFTLENARAIGLAAQLVDDSSVAYVIGTGGSFAAASFIAQLIRSRGKFAMAMRPWEYRAERAPSTDLVVISYSGNTPDCFEAIETARSLGVQRVTVITRTRRSALEKYLDREKGEKVIAYQAEAQLGRERGFISIAATCQPCALFVGALGDGVEAAKVVLRDAPLFDPEVCSVVWGAIRKYRRGHAIASAGTLPVAIDLESKVAESGFGTIQIHDSKDFSHGRFMQVFGSDDQEVPIIYYRTGVATDYENALIETIERNHGATIVKMTSDHEGIMGLWHCFFENQLLFAGIADSSGLDVSRPRHINPGGLRLYKWKREVYD